MAPDAARLFYSNQAVNKYNVDLTNNDAEAKGISAIDVFRGWREQSAYDRLKLRVATMTSTEIGSLLAKILFSVGRPYMLTTNIYMLDGLVNGSVDVLKLFDWETDVDITKRVWLNFDAASTARLAAFKVQPLAELARRRGHMVHSYWIPQDRVEAVFWSLVNCALNLLLTCSNR